jgi:NADH-quinone oxidoreductase subunit K
VGPAAYVLVGMVMFVLGVFTIVSRRNAIYILMGAELTLNAAGLNFVAFSRFPKGEPALDGQVFTIFIVIIAAAEAAVALAILLQIFHHYGTIDVTEIKTLKE